MEVKKLFDELPNINSICCVLGILFPVAASEFDKATLTLAYLYRMFREYVLKGIAIPVELIELCNSLNTICYDERFKQR